MGRIAIVLEAAKPESRAALEHETVVSSTVPRAATMWAAIPFHCRWRYTFARRLPSDLRPIGYWRPITASNSSTVRGQRIRHRLSRQTVGSSASGSRSRSGVMGLMGASAPVSGLQCQGIDERAQPPQCRRPARPVGIFHEDVGVQLGCGGGEGFRQHPEPTDKLRTLCGAQLRRDGEQPSRLASRRSMGSGSDSHSVVLSQDDPDDVATGVTGQEAHPELQVSTRRQSQQQPALARRRVMHAAGLRLGSSRWMAAGEHCPAR